VTLAEFVEGLDHRRLLWPSLGVAQATARYSASEDEEDDDEAPETPPTEPDPIPVQDPPAEPDTAPYVVR
jgi:hypothetical protein